jgi:hypothetical protein
MKNEQSYRIANKLLSNKVYKLSTPIGPSSALNINFTYKFKIIGEITLLSIGEKTSFINVEVEILELNPIWWYVKFDNLNTRLEVEDKLFFVSQVLKSEIEEKLQFFSLFDHVSISKIILNENVKMKNKTINESKGEKRNVVRELVKDIIYIFKNNGVGEYSLPEDINGEMIYNFDNLQTEFSLELRIAESDYVDGIELDGGYYSDEDTLEIEIIYNPSFMPQLYYDLVGQLNETVRHELEHLLQAERGEDIESDEDNPKKYYLQPHELEAQIAGLKRISKIRKQPFEVAVRDWFYKNENKHGLSQKDSEKIIKKILQTHKNE